MIHDVDETLGALIKRDALNGANVEISFEAPTKEWAARKNAPTISVYLYDIREDLERRQVQFEDIRGLVDGRDVIVGRRQPPRKFKLSYLITAWTQRPEDEHRLLSAILSLFIRSDAIPEDVLQGSLAEVHPPATGPEAVRATIALPPPQDRSISDVWTALGGELKPSLDLVVTAPFDSRREFVVGTLVSEAPRIDIGPVEPRSDDEAEERSQPVDGNRGVGARELAFVGKGVAEERPAAADGGKTPSITRKTRTRRS
jgi:hypothetical protein